MRTIDNGIYDRLDGAWWADDSFMALLQHAVNPPRFEYFREVLVERLGKTPHILSVLDVGCGGGLLSERFARLGCTVTGVDRSIPTLTAARAHADTAGLDIRYVPGDASSLPFEAASFDVVLCCDVLEHVDDVEAVIREIARVMKRDAVLFFDTINRTWHSKLLAIDLAQNFALTRLLPRDVHVWEKFVRPSELATSLQRHGLVARALEGLTPQLNAAAASALVRLKLGRATHAEVGRKLLLRRSDDLRVSYMGYATALT